MSKEDIESLWNKESINRLEIRHQEKKVNINNVNGINFFITKGNL